jgi:hypothetical protein
MLTKLHSIENISEIVTQINEMNIDIKHKALNVTNGNILTGNYTLIEEIVNTPLGNFLDSLGDIGEARLLVLESGESYTAHTDPDDRIHLVITTNPDCYLIDLDDEKMYHLPVDGQIWYMDTGVRHVASNFGGRPRIHLNVRVKLPKITYPCYKISVSGGEYDWKQELYDGLMSYLNYGIKNNNIEGIEKISERELLVNCNSDTLNSIIKIITDKKFIVDIIEIYQP